ncbi:MAG: site-specific integrase [Pseudoclavibacter sp.]
MRLRLGQIRAWGRALDLTGFTIGDVEAVLAGRRDQKPETLKSMQCALRSWTRFAMREGVLDRDPLVDLEPVRVPRAWSKPCPDAVFDRAMSISPLRERTMLGLGRWAGLRLSEITTLHSDRVLDDGRLHIIGKGSRHRVIPCAAPLLDLLAERIDETGPGWLFPGRFDPATHMHPQSVEKIMRRCLGMNPHSLRHAAATAAYRSTHDLLAVSAFLGHADISTTQRYLALDMQSLEAVAEGAAA